jgi:hypothetical protein
MVLSKVFSPFRELRIFSDQGQTPTIEAAAAEVAETVPPATSVSYTPTLA